MTIKDTLHGGGTSNLKKGKLLLEGWGEILDGGSEIIKRITSKCI